MEKIKVTYDRPTTNLLVIRCKQSLLIVSNPNAIMSNSASSGYDDENDLGTI